jgi:hypothetical protein
VPRVGAGGDQSLTRPGPPATAAPHHLGHSPRFAGSQGVNLRTLRSQRLQLLPLASSSGIWSIYKRLWDLLSLVIRTDTGPQERSVLRDPAFSISRHDSELGSRADLAQKSSTSNHECHSMLIIAMPDSRLQGHARDRHISRSDRCTPLW